MTVAVPELCETSFSSVKSIVFLSRHSEQETALIDDEECLGKLLNGATDQTACSVKEALTSWRYGLGCLDKLTTKDWPYYSHATAIHSSSSSMAAPTPCHQSPKEKEKAPTSLWFIS